MRHFGVESAEYFIPAMKIRLRKSWRFEAGLDVAEIPRVAA